MFAPPGVDTDSSEEEDEVSDQGTSSVKPSKPHFSFRALFAPSLRKTRHSPGPHSGREKKPPSPADAVIANEAKTIADPSPAKRRVRIFAGELEKGQDGRTVEGLTTTKGEAVAPELKVQHKVDVYDEEVSKQDKGSESANDTLTHLRQVVAKTKAVKVQHDLANPSPDLPYLREMSPDEITSATTKSERILCVDELDGAKGRRPEKMAGVQDDVEHLSSKSRRSMPSYPSPEVVSISSNPSGAPPPAPPLKSDPSAPYRSPSAPVDGLLYNAPPSHHPQHHLNQSYYSSFPSPAQTAPHQDYPRRHDVPPIATQAGSPICPAPPPHTAPLYGYYPAYYPPPAFYAPPAWPSWYPPPPHAMPYPPSWGLPPPHPYSGEAQPPATAPIITTSAYPSSPNHPSSPGQQQSEMTHHPPPPSTSSIREKRDLPYPSNHETESIPHLQADGLQLKPSPLRRVKEEKGEEVPSLKGEIVTSSTEKRERGQVIDERSENKRERLVEARQTVEAKAEVVKEQTERKHRDLPPAEEQSTVKHDKDREALRTTSISRKTGEPSSKGKEKEVTKIAETGTAGSPHSVDERRSELEKMRKYYQAKLVSAKQRYTSSDMTDEEKAEAKVEMKRIAKRLEGVMEDLERIDGKQNQEARENQTEENSEKPRSIDVELMKEDERKSERVIAQNERSAVQEEVKDTGSSNKEERQQAAEDKTVEIEKMQKYYQAKHHAAKKQYATAKLTEEERAKLKSEIRRIEKKLEGLMVTDTAREADTRTVGRNDDMAKDGELTRTVERKTKVSMLGVQGHTTKSAEGASIEAEDRIAKRLLAEQSTKAAEVKIEGIAHTVEPKPIEASRAEEKARIADKSLTKDRSQPVETKADQMPKVAQLEMTMKKLKAKYSVAVQAYKEEGVDPELKRKRREEIKVIEERMKLMMKAMQEQGQSRSSKESRSSSAAEAVQQRRDVRTERKILENEADTKELEGERREKVEAKDTLEVVAVKQIDESDVPDRRGGDDVDKKRAAAPKSSMTDATSEKGDDSDTKMAELVQPPNVERKPASPMKVIEQSRDTSQPGSKDMGDITTLLQYAKAKYAELVKVAKEEGLDEEEKYKRKKRVMTQGEVVKGLMEKIEVETKSEVTVKRGESRSVEEVNTVARDLGGVTSVKTTEQREGKVVAATGTKPYEEIAASNETERPDQPEVWAPLRPIKRHDRSIQPRDPSPETQVASLSTEQGLTGGEVTWSRTLVSLATCIDLAQTMLKSMTHSSSSEAHNPLSKILPRVLTALMMQRDLIEILRGVVGEAHDQALEEFGRHLGVVRRWLEDKVEDGCQVPKNVDTAQGDDEVNTLIEGSSRALEVFSIQSIVEYLMGLTDYLTPGMITTVKEIINLWRTEGFGMETIVNSVLAIRKELKVIHDIQKKDVGKEECGKTRGVISALDILLSLISPEHSDRQIKTTSKTGSDPQEVEGSSQVRSDSTGNWPTDYKKRKQQTIEVDVVSGVTANDASPRGLTQERHLRRSDARMAIGEPDHSRTPFPALHSHYREISRKPSPQNEIEIQVVDSEGRTSQSHLDEPSHDRSHHRVSDTLRQYKEKLLGRELRPTTSDARELPSTRKIESVHDVDPSSLHLPETTQDFLDGTSSWKRPPKSTVPKSAEVEELKDSLRTPVSAGEMHKRDTRAERHVVPPMKDTEGYSEQWELRPGRQKASTIVIPPHSIQVPTTLPPQTESGSSTPTSSPPSSSFSRTITLPPSSEANSSPSIYSQSSISSSSSTATNESDEEAAILLSQADSGPLPVHRDDRDDVDLTLKDKRRDDEDVGPSEDEVKRAEKVLYDKDLGQGGIEPMRPVRSGLRVEVVDDS
ncbi:hypothetical protein CI109_102113 [Kwoniella shandongensis]|uniref:Uncharacterized protein n=1 Tax=Kwoniella shandongensis TaxID=1734106 RepID=A0A5M6BMZ4_9TREE|nr:uncharacterized protein CI109_007433 [Kwoniella shandongensis]KAA5524236.1 hypothetical protein CI109_007433 [Kwoniella shandongensis]